MRRRWVLLTIIPLLIVFAGMIFAGQSFDFGTYKARELRKSGVWINSSPLTLKALRGKVVVIDFWAFDCEPCIQAMPRIKELYNEYSSEGLIVIGVHTPRAEYEKDVSKLREAITRMGIQFPVVVDEKQKMFRDYLCDLWPSQFVIDRSGVVRYSHGGVGRYDDMEEVVQNLLKGH
jgi:thiol-disulfide isomerase/thioredoxin